MPLKLIVSSFIFALLAVYIAFLNPHEVEIHLTQSYSLKLPMVVLCLTSILIGVFAAGVLNWALEIKFFIRRMRWSFQRKRQAKQYARIEKLYEQGENAFAGGRFDKSAPFFQKILKIHPNHIGALNYMGIIRKMEGNLSQALEFHREAAKQAPDNLKVLYSLAEDYSAAEMFEKEMELLEKIRKIDRNSPTPLSKMRDALLKMEDWSGASAVQKKIVPLISNKEEREKELKHLGHLIYSNGMRFYQSGNHQAAIPEFKRAIRENPFCLPAHIALGDTYQKSGNPKAALKAWKSGFEKTRSPICLLRMQKTHQESNNSDAVIKIYQEAVQSAKNSEKDTLVMMLGALYLDKGLPNDAVRELEGIKPEKSLLHSLLLTRSYQETRETGRLEQDSLSAFEQARETLLQFTCRACHTSLQDWSGQCPVCNGWDSISCGTFSN